MHCWCTYWHHTVLVVTIYWYSYMSLYWNTSKSTSVASYSWHHTVLVVTCSTCRRLCKTRAYRTLLPSRSISARCTRPRIAWYAIYLLYWYKSTSGTQVLSMFARCTRRRIAWYALHLFYWHKGTNTDAECAALLGAAPAVTPSASAVC